MKLFFILGQKGLARTLDIKGRNKAVTANLIPMLAIIGSASYWVITKNNHAMSVLLGLVAILTSFILGVHLQMTALIESVYRCKDEKNKQVYKKNKAYFDEKFKKLGINDRPCIKQHIIKQQGGEDGGRK